VLLVNKDPDTARDVAIDYPGFTPADAPPTVYSYVNGGTSVTSARTGSATAQTLPPYSLTTIVLHPASKPTGGPGAPGRPTASGVTDRTATLSWPAAAPGAKPIAKYEVYRQNGAISEELGETASTSLTVRNLTPGTRYTVNVLARDTAGKVSWSSLPLTFTTGSPATSTCTVRFTDSSDWASGYVAGVDITNNGPDAIDGWTLTFTWPTGRQQLSSGWNATWTQEGRDVKATSLDTNGKLAAGGSVSIGFVGAYSGPNILPPVFALNGAVCTTA
jgi:cellulase/cellobiase CelA1